jgi:hypothetical protein
MLEVLWYDPQGCIRTTPIDILNQLPLLMVLVQAQRRSGYLSGLRKTAVPGNFDLISDAAPRFQLIGRMTSCGKLKASSTPSSSAHISGDDEPTHFFKSSWTEDVRHKEHEVITTAVVRVKALLPEQYHSFVLDHLPTISGSSEIYDSSTAIVRTLLGLSTDGARTQYLMHSELLSNLLDIASDFEKFRDVLRDVVRGMLYVPSGIHIPHDSFISTPASLGHWNRPR